MMDDLALKTENEETLGRLDAHACARHSVVNSRKIL
jgi:hypothetical protein